MPDRFALGRQPADPTKPKLRLRAAPERPQPPAFVDWLSQVQQWGMLANDRLGDCTAAGAAHVAMAVDRYGQDRDLQISETPDEPFGSSLRSRWIDRPLGVNHLPVVILS